MTAETTAASFTEPVVQRLLLRRILRNPLTVGSLVILAIFIIVAVIEPWILPFPPNYVQLRLTNADPFTSEFMLGGDKYGRDILSRLIASARGALLAAVVLAAVASMIGVTAGLIAGYFGKAVDAISSWVFSVIMAVPGVILLISLYTLLGTSTTVAMAVFGVLVAPQMFLMVRTLTRSVRNEAYVDAAKVSGLSNTRIVGRHVLTAIRAPVILMVASLAGAGIAVQASLEFLGLGEPSQPSWGAMLTEAFSNVYIAPDQLVWPALALGLVTSAFTLVSIGVRDALEGTYVRPSKRDRARQLERLRAGIGPAALPARMQGGVQPLLVIDDLRVAYPAGDGMREVVRGVSLDVTAGEVVGIVGESGSGKTQTIFATLGLLAEEAVTTGSIRLDGRELLGLGERQWRSIRGRDIAYVPQEPMANLDPSFTIGAQLMFGIRASGEATRTRAREQALSMLDRVGIRDPRRVFDSYPHQISGEWLSECSSPEL